MENYSITMRIYTKLGKEHIYHVDYYRTDAKTLIVYSSQEDDIFQAITYGEPCCISLLSNDEYQYSESRFNRCCIEDNTITFMSYSKHTTKSL